MPYKDKEAKLKASRESMRKKRGFIDGLTSGVNNGGVNGKGLTRIEFIQGELNDPYLVRDIESVAKFKDDRDIRHERAYIYKLKREGHKLGTIIGKSLIELREMT